MSKNIIFLILILVVVGVVALAWILLTPPPYETPIVLPPIPEEAPSANAVEKITEGTTGSDIEQDLDMLLQQENTILGDLEAEMQQLEQQLNAEGF